MEFSPACDHCRRNEQVHTEKKRQMSESSKRYYLRNREAIIIRNVKNYYRKKNM